MTRSAFPLLAVLASSPAWAQSFLNFESGHVRPLALSPDGTKLFAVNTPDNRLAVYAVGPGGLTLSSEVSVGLEPVAVAARNNGEVWVVNHLSDSVSIVDVAASPPHVVRTLLVGDEPRDIVFAGGVAVPGPHDRAFVTCAHRGQNRPGDPQLTTEGVGRADVWAFDANNLGAALGGTPLSIIQLFGDTPRALAATPDGSVVYAAIFQSGNQTTAITESVVSGNGGLPPPPTGSTPNAPSTGLIVKFNPANSHWEDEIGRNWSPSIPFSLPDDDVFLIDANANPPALFSTQNVVTGVGTVLFNMIVRPTNGKVYVANTDARNEVRFEPHLDATHGVNGHLAESRVTVISGTTATSHHLNPHINYNVIPGPPAEVNQSLAFPGGMAFSADGNTLFVAGFGSGKIGAFNADDLEAGVITESQVTVGLGPSGVVLDAANDRLYVMNRIAHTISVIGNASSPSRALTATIPLRFDPSPPAAKNGRIFLYDARISAHGDSACASCHIFADFDSLAWDLGDPFGQVASNPVPFRLDVNQPPHTFHPMKGPMTTQSIRGLAAAGVMHWRGDRNGGSSNPVNEDLSFKAFNPAFVGLLGNATQLSAADMQSYTDFILTVRYPPNPIRALDNSMTAAQSAGSTFFDGTTVDGGFFTCEFCHSRPLGTHRDMSFEGEPQEFKIAHLRNIYQKVGKFGVPAGAGAPATGNLGDQVRGFGFLHDGSIDTVFDFLHASVFQFGSNADTKRRNLEAFAFAFDTGLAPIVGQQVSATSTTFSNATVTGRINLMIARAQAGECDLVVKGNLAGQARGWLFDSPSGLFRSDRASEGFVPEATLRGQAGTAGQELTYTAVPPGNGTRIGLDRDGDGFFDRTELDAGSDPANPASVPGATTTTTTTTSTTTTTTATTTTTTTTQPTTTTTTTQPTTTTTTTQPTTTTTTTQPTTTTVTTTTTTATQPSTTTTTQPTTTTTTTTQPTTTTTTTSTASTSSSTSTTTTVTTSTATTSSTTTTTQSTTTTTTLPLVRVQAGSFSLRDDTTPPPNPGARQIKFSSSTGSDPLPNRIVAPDRGSDGDPTVHGATLRVYDSAGTGELVTVALAATGWTTLGSAASPAGFRFKATDPGAPIRSVFVKRDRIKLGGGGAGWGYTLDELSQGSVALRLSMGTTGVTWCAETGRAPYPARVDRIDRFVSLPKTPAPAVCPALP